MKAHAATTGNTFNYTYDKLNRLKTAASAGTVMSESLSYDDMGNIRTLVRDGATTTYAYNNSNKSGRLLSLTGSIKGSYTYDGNGNAKTDRTGMTFTYNHLNLPQTAVKSGTSVSYLYDALGTKLRKTAAVGNVTTVRDYIAGIEYNKTGTAASIIERIATEEGYLQNSSGTYSYHYNLTDHLGNVRAVLKRGSSSTAPEVVQQQDYYAFGKTKSIVIGGINRYLYNGKEVQAEIGDQLDYGARFYDAEIGRWNVVDPKAELLEMSSPYVYSLNNPSNFLDKDGELPIYINGRVTGEGQRGDKSYWDYQLLWTIASSGIPNPGGESHFVDGDQFQYGSNVHSYNSSWERVPNAINRGHYADGGNFPDLRSNAGYTYGKADFENVLAKLARDPKTGKITEKIQIYTHSRGAAFGAGYTQALLEMIKANADMFADASNVIDFVYNMGPHQSGSITSPSGVNAYSQDHTLDALSGNDMGGLKRAFTSNETSGGIFGPHSTSSFKNDVAGF